MVNVNAPRTENPVEGAVAVPSFNDNKSQDDKAQAATMEDMRKYFDGQKKVSVKVREQAWVQVNGYTFIIEPDVRVEVPEDIATMLETRGLI